MDESKDILSQGDVGEGDTSENSVTENTEVASEPLPEQGPPKQAYRVVVVLKRLMMAKNFSMILLL